MTKNYDQMFTIPKDYYKMSMSIEDIEELFSKYAALPRVDYIYAFRWLDKVMNDVKDYDMVYYITSWQDKKAVALLIKRIITSTDLKKEAEKFHHEIFDVGCSLTESMYTYDDIGVTIDGIFNGVDSYFKKVARKASLQEKRKGENTNEKH